MYGHDYYNITQTYDIDWHPYVSVTLILSQTTKWPYSMYDVKHVSSGRRESRAAGFSFFKLPLWWGVQRKVYWRLINPHFPIPPPPRRQRFNRFRKCFIGDSLVLTGHITYDVIFDTGIVKVDFMCFILIVHLFSFILFLMNTKKTYNQCHSGILIHIYSWYRP